MVSKEDFKKVWKDSSTENILNQFYYEHYELLRIKKEVREYIEPLVELDNDIMLKGKMLKPVLEILEKENK